MFTILIDSREQTPFSFGPEWKIKRSNLVTGDYTISGLSELISIERKSLQDLVGCVGGNRERFKKELHRLQAYPCRAVIIECELADIYSGNYRGKVKPASVAGSLASWGIRYKVPFVFAGEYGASYALAIMRNYYQQCREFAETFKVA